MNLPSSLSDGIIFDDGPFGALARELYFDRYDDRFSTENPHATRVLTPIPLSDPRKTRDAVIRLLRENIDTIERMSMFDMHVVGMHSLVLHHDPSLMLRIYVQPRGRDMAINTDWSIPYLYHPHRYHFMCAALEGSILNQRYLLDESGKDWHEYTFSSQIVHGKAAIQRTREVGLAELPLERIEPGTGYLMEAPEIHRVGFVSDPASGWCIVLFYEFTEKMPAPFAYARHVLDDIPDRPQLYRKPTRPELDALIDRICAVLGHEEDAVAVEQTAEAAC
jgi:hypothetical protein